MNSKGIIANSFPKSGTHILTQILFLLGYTQADTHLSRSLLVYGSRNIIRNIKVHGRIEKRSNNGLLIDIENKDRAVKENWFISHVNNKLTSGKYSQGHLPYSEKLDEMLLCNDVKMLYIHRNPLDVLVSLKNYILKKKNYPNHKMLVECKNDSERFLLLINGNNEGDNRTLMAPFFEKYKMSKRWVECDLICSVKFEKIIGSKGGGNSNDQKAELLKIIKYLGENERDIEQIQHNIYNPKSDTFHKGIIGQWRKEIPIKILDICNQKLEDANLSVDEYIATT
ncbi:MAG: sulfotransferase domain-containing protein [Saprospiraceae bacterium]